MVQSGVVKARTEPSQLLQHPTCRDAVQRISRFLPDLDTQMNDSGDSRVLVRWETINEHMKVEAGTRHVVAKDAAIMDFDKTCMTVEDSNTTSGHAFHAFQATK